MKEVEERAFLAELFDAAVSAALPERVIAGYLPPLPEGRTIVIGAGKGAAQMAAAFEAHWPGPLDGVVVTRHGQSCPTRQIRVLEAAHPVPDAAGLAASEALLEAVAGLTERDLVVALICGGGSALLPAPPEGISFEEEIELNRALLASGAPISVMNAIRKQVSRIKGGRLALAAAPARVVTLVLSDVPGDDPAQVASGPTIPDGLSRATARELAETWKIALPPAIAARLAGEEDPCPTPDDPRFARNEVHVMASARLSLEAAAAHAEAAGFSAVILSDAIEGEAREVAKVHAALLRECLLRGRPFARPVVLLSGGETTVTLGTSTGGSGGRNTEFQLSLALAGDGMRFSALAADTDGIDGSGPNAGAFVDGTSAARLRNAGMDPARLLAGHDSRTAFAGLGDLFSPGPTGTNVNDFRAILLL